MRREVVESELGTVPRAKLKAKLREIEADPTIGKPLTGALKGCRSTRVGGSENRIVYREIEIDGEPACEVLAIGRRRENSVYESAEGRADT